MHVSNMYISAAFCTKVSLCVKGTIVEGKENYINCLVSNFTGFWNFPHFLRSKKAGEKCEKIQNPLEIAQKSFVLILRSLFLWLKESS